MRSRKDKYNLLGDPLDEKVKADAEKKRNQEYHKARSKGTGKVDRSYHRKMEDL